MEKKRIRIALAYVACRFREAGKPYRDQWLERFERCEEWAFSDYSGRRTLQALDPDYYPKDIDALFPNPKPSIIQIERKEK